MERLYELNLVGERYPRDVVEFGSTHHITRELDLAVTLMNQAFPDAQSVTDALEQDPDSPHPWISVDVRVAGNARDIRTRHRHCVRRLLGLLPWPASTLVRTNYTLV